MKNELLTADDVINMLGLIAHPKEGGFYRETYRSSESIPRKGLPIRYVQEKPFSTCIYYLLTPETCSRIHRLHSDEIFHFYCGDPVTMLQLHSQGEGEIITLGNDLTKGEIPQVLVPKGVWQGAFLNPEGSFALLGTTVAPGFDFEDYEEGERHKIVDLYPDFEELITRLTP